MNEKFVYRHVWKSGGSTIGTYKRVGQKYLTDPLVSDSNKVWMTFVRDPISHFLSGWSECGLRSIEGQLKKLRGEIRKKGIFSKKYSIFQ